MAPGPRLRQKVTTHRAAALPVALTIAGSDSGGGAGIQADLKTFAALKVHGVTAITCLTAQNPLGVLGIMASTPDILSLQLETVFAELPPQAAKTGMLYSAPLIERTVEFFANRPCPLVVDPVMVSTSGAQLLKTSAVQALTRKLLPICSLLTPNLDEAALLLGRALKNVPDLRGAARELHERFGCAVLVKGGHLRRLKEAIDIFYNGKEELLLSAPFVRGVSTHGTGCTYSAAITAWLARGTSLSRAVQAAKDYISKAIAQSRRVANHTVLNSFWD